MDAVDASRAESTLPKSIRNPSATHRRSSCAVKHLYLVDRHLSVTTHGTLTRTSCATSPEQLHAQAVLDDSNFCETPGVHHSLPPCRAEGCRNGPRRKVPSSSVKPDDGGDDVFCHVGDPKHGGGDIDEGNAAKPKVFSEDMLGTCLTQTAKQSCEPSARPAAVRCMMAGRGIDRGSPRCQTPVPSNNRAGASSRPRRKRREDTECSRKHPAMRCTRRATW